MAGKVKGITIEIGGETTGLKNALKDVDSQLKNTEYQLRQVNSSLKLDPTNVSLLDQKYRTLQDAILQTTSKLATLKEALKQADASGVDKNSNSYKELEREIEPFFKYFKKLSFSFLAEKIFEAVSLKKEFKSQSGLIIPLWIKTFLSKKEFEK